MRTKNPATDDEEPQVEQVDPIAVFNRYRELKDLYNCINPLIGEMSICTKSYLAPTTRVIDEYGVYDKTFGADIYLIRDLKFHLIVEVEHADEILYQNRDFVKPRKSLS